MKKIAIIGANGFIGQNLMSELKGHELIALSRSEIDITDLDSVSQAFVKFKPNVVINLAADKRRGSAYSDFRKTIDTNIIGTLNIVEASKLSSIEHLIFIGSGEEYGSNVAPFEEEQKESPVSAYSFSKTSSKILLETLSRLGPCPFTYIRPTLVYGPGQDDDMFLPSLIRNLKSGKKFPLSLGEQVRDFIHVNDLINAIDLIIKTGKKTFGQTYNVASEEKVSIKDLANMVAKDLKAEDLLEFGAVAYRNAEIFDYRVSAKKIQNDLGWKLKIKLKDGLRDLLH